MAAIDLDLSPPPKTLRNFGFAAFLAFGAVILAVSVVHHLARFLCGLSSAADGEGGEV